MARLTSGRGRRTAAALATTSLVVAGLGFTSAPATATPAGDRAVNASATWLTSQLTDGIVHNDEYDFDDLGLSADFALALKAVGKDATASSIVTALEPDSEGWVAGFTPGRVYAGSLAKLVSVAQVTGKDATAFNSIDQVARLEGLVSSTTPLTGRLEDAGVDASDPFDGDFVNVIGQSFAARSLTTAGSSRAADATSFLLKQQCNDGFFRATLTVDKTAAEQGCVSGDTGSVDTTALTVINILDTPGTSTAAKGAAALAADWLKSQQAADGSFSAGASEGYNANSTGLAGWALAKAGDDASAAKAAGWLRGVQIADLAPCVTTLTAENGAIAYKSTELGIARANGAIAPGKRDQFRRATAQALPALANLAPGTGALGVSAPATAVEKSTVTVTVAGLGAGEAGCVSFGSVAKPVTGTGADVTVTFDLPAGAAANTFTLTTLAGSQTAVTNSTLAPVVTPTPTTTPIPNPTPTPTPTPTQTPKVGALKASKLETAKKGKFKLAVRCDEDVACTGKIFVRTAFAMKVGKSKAPRKVLVARSTYSVKPGSTERVVLKLLTRARGVFADGRTVRVKAFQTAGEDSAITKFRLRSK